MTTAPETLRRGRGGLAASGGMIAAALLVTACGSAAAPAPAVTKTVTAGAGGSASATTGTSAPAPVTSSAAAGAAPGCLGRYLSVRTADGNGAAGSTYLQLVFTNLNNASCTLYGFPGVSLAGGTPVKQIGLGAAEDNSNPRVLVTLAPHGTAHAQLRVVNAANFPASTCHLVPSKYLQVFPPNQTAPLYAFYPAQACTKSVRLLTVGVVQPGPTS
jgi:hypothetical protein